MAHPRWSAASAGLGAVNSAGTPEVGPTLRRIDPRANRRSSRHACLEGPRLPPYSAAEPFARGPTEARPRESRGSRPKVRLGVVVERRVVLDPPRSEAMPLLSCHEGDREGRKKNRTGRKPAPRLPPPFLPVPRGSFPAAAPGPGPSGLSQSAQACLGDRPALAGGRPAFRARRTPAVRLARSDPRRALVVAPDGHLRRRSSIVSPTWTLRHRVGDGGPWASVPMRRFSQASKEPLDDRAALRPFSGEAGTGARSGSAQTTPAGSLPVRMSAVWSASGRRLEPEEELPRLARCRTWTSPPARWVALEIVNPTQKRLVMLRQA